MDDWGTMENWPEDDQAHDDLASEFVKCGNCGTPMNVIERSVDGLAIAYRCPRPDCICHDDEYWPYEDTPLAPDVDSDAAYDAWLAEHPADDEPV